MTDIQQKQYIAGGDFLLSLREESGQSQSEVCQKLGLDCFSVLANWEKGLRPVPPTRFYAYAQALKVTDVHTFAMTLLKAYYPEVYQCLTQKDAMNDNYN